MTTPVSTNYTMEIELSLTGVFQSGCAAWGGSRFEPPINPPESPCVEDLDIEDIRFSIATTAKEREVNGGKRWRDVSILKGVDRKSEAFRQIVANVVELIGDDAAASLMEDAYAV